MLRRIFKILKWTFGSIIGAVVVIGVIGFLFVGLSPQFGGKASEAQKIQYAATGHYSDGVFTNKEEIVMEVDCHSVTQMLKELLDPDPHIAPLEDIAVVKVPKDILTVSQDGFTRITWLGHSSFLLEMDGKKILLDPVFSQYAAPHALLGRQRYSSQMPFELADIPHVDAVIISHDHYDHLDYESIVQLKDKTDAFFVPLGVGNHLRRWEIADDRIHEMDWWEETQLGTIRVAFTPSRHMSGRSLNDQSATLWGSWVLTGAIENVFFSGDGGYGEHFKFIGEQYGPFDIGLMECGQYNVLWADIHMMPAQTVQASFDVGAEMILPIHWGAFTLASHSWTHPIETVTANAAERGLPVTTPQIGESFILGNEAPKDAWWEQYK